MGGHGHQVILDLPSDVYNIASRVTIKQTLLHGRHSLLAQFIPHFMEVFSDLSLVMRCHPDQDHGQT